MRSISRRAYYLGRQLLYRSFAMCTLPPLRRIHVLRVGVRWRVHIDSGSRVVSCLAIITFPFAWSHSERRKYSGICRRSISYRHCLPRRLCPSVFLGISCLSLITYLRMILSSQRMVPVACRAARFSSFSVPSVAVTTLNSASGTF